MARADTRRTIALLPALACVASIASLPTPATAEHAALDRARQAGYRVVEIGERHGLAGYLLQAPAGGGETTLYITADGAALAGELFGPDGTSVTAVQVRRAANRSEEDGSHRGNATRIVRDAQGHGTPGSIDPRWPARAAGDEHPASTAGSGASDTPDFSLSRLLVAPAEAHAGGEVRTVSIAGDPGGDALRGGGAFVLVAGRPSITVFADPRCGPSRDWLRTLERISGGQDGEFGIVVAPVGLLGAQSAAAAISILGSASPRDAWIAWEQGIEPTWPVDAGLGAERVRRNHQLWDGLPGSSVPVSVWDRHVGREAMVGGPTAGAFRWHWRRVQAESGQ